MKLGYLKLSPVFENILPWSGRIGPYSDAGFKTQFDPDLSNSSCISLPVRRKNEKM